MPGALLFICGITLTKNNFSFRVPICYEMVHSVKKYHVSPSSMYTLGYRIELNAFLLYLIILRLNYKSNSVFCRELAPGTVSLTSDRVRGDDSKITRSFICVLFIVVMCCHFMTICILK